MKQHRELNRVIYGNDFDAARVLRGEVAPPPEFQPVYDLLAAYTAEASARVTAGKAERSATRRPRRLQSMSTDEGSVVELASASGASL